MNLPKNKRHVWTSHIVRKMLYYSISPSRITRIINTPDRVEDSIVPDTIAAMKKFNAKDRDEFWVMYVVNKQDSFKKSNLKGLVLISAWRYPGISPKRNPIPVEILNEIRQVMTGI